MLVVVIHNLGILILSKTSFFGDLQIGPGGRKPPVNQSSYDTLETEQIFCMICSLKAIKQIEIFCMHKGYIDIRRKLEGGDGGGGGSRQKFSATVFNRFVLLNLP